MTLGFAESTPGAAERGRGVVFDAVSVAYRQSVVLDQFSLEIAPGEVMALIGPSGSGKSTAMRCVAGFVRPLRGRVLIGATDVTQLPPHARDIGMVVQNYALFPHMTIEDNVAFGLRARQAPRAHIARRIAECLQLVGMAALRGRYPRQLSGGQQQRVAIARALAIEPSVLLLDEPLSALDAQIRRAMVEELANLHQSLPGLTVLYVTHDQSEALTLADRIALLKDGRLCAVGDTHALYTRPPNRFTAEFLGNANLLPVHVTGVLDDGCALVQLEATTLRVQLPPPPARALPAGAALLCVRPHALQVRAADCSEPNCLQGVVLSEFWHGDQQTLRVQCGGLTVRLVAPPMLRLPPPGHAIRFSFAPSDACLVPLDASDAQV